ncbi:MAG: hypothetical protein ACTSYW_02575 [Candidatus Heimdallarchaeota archaeon]
MLDEGDKNTCKELAREIIAEVIKEHMQTCVHGINLAKTKAFMVGLMIGCGILGGATGPVILKILSSLS